MITTVKRPIVFFDLETTGVDVRRDRIVEISLIKVTSSNQIWMDVVVDQKITQKINPGIPIPESATAVHGIKDDDVVFEPQFSHVAPMIIDFIDGCDIAGFNSNSFDLRMLYAEFIRCNIEWDYKKHNLIDVGNMFKQLQPRTLSAAYKHYMNEEHVDSHGAEADAKATLEVFAVMVVKHSKELPDTIEDLALYSNFGKEILDLSGCFGVDDDGDIIFKFGKHIAKKAKLERPYLEWMCKSDFAIDTKRIAIKILEDGK